MKRIHVTQPICQTFMSFIIITSRKTDKQIQKHTRDVRKISTPVLILKRQNTLKSAHVSL